MNEPADDLRTGLAADLEVTLGRRAVLCVTGRIGAAETVSAALTALGRSPVFLNTPYGAAATTSDFARALYTALELPGPIPCDLTGIDQCVDARTRGAEPVLVVPSAETLHGPVLRELVCRWTRTPGPCPLILTGTDQLREALADAGLGAVVLTWRALDVG
ncbi:ATP-binding protein [Streptomyces sp. NPDC059063]|uniref:ATP-binding protein n=1 Tax=unclassified Streptomyces TaxID=2593676 RepID=UPI00367D6B59